MKYFIPDAALIGNGFIVDSLVQGETTNIPAVVNFIYTGGYYTAGDRGSGQYYRVATEPTHPGKFQSADGAWWELVSTLANAFMFGAKGDNIQDDTNYIHAMRDYIKATNNIGQILPASYLVSELLFDGSDYTIYSYDDTKFFQTPGLTGDSNYHPIITFSGSNISFGSGYGKGNIATDVDEYSPFVYVSAGCNNITIGDLYGEDLRGDVITVYGYELNQTHNIKVGNVSGTNIFRCLAAVIGGQVDFNDITNDGPVGLCELRLEPNAPDGGGTYQKCSVTYNNFTGGILIATSADITIDNNYCVGNYTNLDWNLIAATTPPYPSAPGANAYGLGLSYIETFTTEKLTYVDYQSYPILLTGDTWDNVNIGAIFGTLSNKTDLVYQAQILNIGTAGRGQLNIGYMDVTQYQSDGYMFRSDIGQMFVTVNGGKLTNGSLGANIRANISFVLHDINNVAITNCISMEGSRLYNVSFVNASLATLLYSSTDCILQNVTGTFATLFSNSSNNCFCVNTVLNGIFYRADYLSSDAPNKSSIATLTAGSVVVAFGTAQADANYHVLLGGDVNETFYADTKTVNGFTIHSSNAASTANVTWQINRTL